MNFFQRDSTFFSIKKIFFIFTFLIFSIFSYQSVYAQTPPANTPSYEYMSDADVAKVDRTKTRSYIEPYTNSNEYYVETLYFDSAGRPLGRRNHGNADGTVGNANVYLKQGTPSGLPSNDGSSYYILRENFWASPSPDSYDLVTKKIGDVEYVTLNRNDTSGSPIPEISGGQKNTYNPDGSLQISQALAVNGQPFGARTDSGVCIFSTIGWDNYSTEQAAGASFWNCVEQVLYGILKIFTWALGFSVWIFNIVFEMMVIGMSKFIKNIQAINVVWKVFRDATNICFIFILLYLSISTIIGTNEHGVKHTLSKLIMVAILVNFSMFFAKVVVDTSNILAISFYKKIQPTEHTADFKDLVVKTYSQKDNKLNGIAGAFMGSFSLQKIFKDTETSGENLIERELFAAKPDAGTTFVMGSIVIFIVFCIFLAASIIFIKRMVIIIILIMTSSLAFAATLFHQTEGKAHEWWEKLIAEAFYAPVFVAIIWLALLVMTDTNFAGTFEAKEAEGWFNVGTVINYIIVINFFIMALVIGEKMGASSASGAMKSYKWLKSNIGGRGLQMAYRNTAGRLGFNMLEAKEGSFAHRLQDWRMKAVNGDARVFGIKGTKKLAQIIAPALDSAFHGMAHGKLADAGNSFEEEINERKENANRYKAENKQSPGMFAEFVLNQVMKGKKNVLEKQVGDSIWDDVKDPKEKANLLKYMQDLESKETNAGKKEDMKDAIKRLLEDRPTGEESDKIRRVMEAEHLQFNSNKVASILEEKDPHDSKVTIYSHKATKTRIDELRAKTTRTKEEDEELNKKQKEYNAKKIEMRQFVSKLTTAQKMGLRKDQIEHEDLRDLFQGNDLEQLQRNNILSKEGYKNFADEMNKNLPTLNLYADAKWNTDPMQQKDAYEALKKHVKEKAESLGETVDDTEAKILEYYENNLLSGYGATAKHDGLGRFFKSDALENGKDMLEKIRKYREAVKGLTPTPAPIPTPTPTPAPAPTPHTPI